MSRSIRLASAGLVAAAVLAIAACGTSTSSGDVAGATGTPATSAAPPASASAPASMEPSAEASPSGALNQAFLQFEPQNDSNITGGAILTDLGDNQTAVTIGVVAPGVTEPMPANIVPNDCASAGPASPAPSAAASEAPAASGAASLDPTTILKLGDLAAGSSNTVLALTLDALLEQPHAVVIYRSPTDGTIVACADIVR